MKSGKIQRQSGMLGSRLLVFTFLIMLTGFGSVAIAYDLPADRTITWQGNVGVTGDIPNRTTICATLSQGATAANIQTAINNCSSGQVVFLNAGSYSISSSIQIKSNVTLRGAGIGKTILKSTSGYSGWSLVKMDSSEVIYTSYNLSSGYIKGSTVLTTSGANTLAIGDIVVIDELNDAAGDPPVDGGAQGCNYCGRASGTRLLGQLNKVVGINPSLNQVTVETPIYFNFQSGLTPQITKIGPMTSNAGIEDLTVDNTANTSSVHTVVQMERVENCWLLRVEAKGSHTRLIELKQAYRCTVRETTGHNYIGSCCTSDRAYGFFMTYGDSGNLVENNMFYELSNPILIEGPCSGNVFAYNYLKGVTTNTVEPNRVNGVMSYHGAYPVYNLFEGNYSEGMWFSDNYHGGSGYNTLLRNRHYAQTGKTQYVWDYMIMKNSRYFNFIGNVIGTSGNETIYEKNCASYSSTNKMIYFLGYNDISGNTSTCDTNVVAGLIRHGNWDSVNNGIIWNGTDDQNLPASLYLTSKPSWWGNGIWPPIGPDVPGYSTNIPALDRFRNASAVQRPSPPKVWFP